MRYFSHPKTYLKPPEFSKKCEKRKNNFMMFAKKLRSLTNKSNTIVHLRMSQNMVRGTNPDDCTIFILIPAFFSRAPLSALEASFLRGCNFQKMSSNVGCSNVSSSVSQALVIVLSITSILKFMKCILFG